MSLLRQRLSRRIPVVMVAVVAALLPACGYRPVAPERAVVPARAAAQPAVGVQYHGLWSDWSDTDRTVVLDRMGAAGVGWLRIDVGWEALEERGPGQPSEWYLSRLDETLEAARTRRMQVLVTLWATPAWANGGQSRAVPPSDPNQYARVAGWLASRYRDRVSAWEIWNEPNSSDFFAGDAATYVRLLRPAHAAIDAADPDTKVVLGGPSYNDTEWLEQVYRAGARESFDVMATHPYLGPSDMPPETPDDGSPWTLLHVARVQALMAAHGDGSKPIWFTEFGWSTHANGSDTKPWQRGVSPTVQADYLVRTLELLRRQLPQVSHVFWYTARDRDDSDVHTNGYGLLTVDLRAKPAYEALRNYVLR
ncbi:MAG: cellulase family glycosylhydrolase [Acidimicrobiia bacterium]|nr:cellulase family glycosylhydrolase [Acidimicrobiia bacterium]